MLGPGPPSQRLAAEPVAIDDVRAVVGRIAGRLKPAWRALLGVSVLVAITTALQVVMPKLISEAVDRGIIAGDLADLAKTTILLLIAYLLSTAGVWWQSVVMIRIAQRLVRDLRAELFGHLQRLSLRFFDSRPHGELLSSLTNDTDTLSNTLGQTVTRLIGSLLTLIGVAAAMLVMNWRLGILTLVMVPVSAFITRRIALLARKSYRDRQQYLAELNGLIEETVTGQRVIKICRREARTIGEFETSNNRLRDTAIRAEIIGGVMGPMMNFVNNLTFAVVAASGGFLVIRDLATVGTVAAFIAYARQFGRPINELAMLYTEVQSAIAGAERVFAILDEQPEIIDPPEALGLSQVAGEVVFDDVTFGYDPAVPALQEVSFTAPPGSKIALVGPTGAGKTTIINLLSRFYDVDRGEIRIDSQPVGTLRLDDLRRTLGIVLQDTFLFADTVRENIRYGRLGATDEEVERAARLANAESFIHRLPQGYDTHLSEAGSALSQGQRQLLSIARAILAEPPILILDEATSSVDSRTEAQIQEAMLRLMEGRTSFVIAHRLSTIREADLILVIEHGRIIERGNHAELLAARGHYAAYCASQFGGEVAA